jgi:hypothetical protein
MAARVESTRELRKVPFGAPSEGLSPERDSHSTELRGETHLGMAQIFDLGIRGLRDEFGWLLLVSAMVWFPLRLVPTLLSSGNAENDLAATVLLTINNGIAQTVTTALLARRLAAGYRERGALIPEPQRLLVACLPGIVGLGLVTGIATGIGMCMLLIPGIYLSFKLSLAPTILVLEDGSMGDAIRRSLHLSTSSFWRWAGLMLSMLVLAGPISSGIGVLEQPVVRQEVYEWSGLSAAAFAWIYAALSSVLLAFAAALTAAVMTAYYFDLLVRRDGVDLAQQLRQLRARSSEA